MYIFLSYFIQSDSKLIQNLDRFFARHFWRTYWRAPVKFNTFSCHQWCFNCTGMCQNVMCQKLFCFLSSREPRWEEEKLKQKASLYLTNNTCKKSKAIIHFNIWLNKLNPKKPHQIPSKTIKNRFSFWFMKLFNFCYERAVPNINSHIIF